MRFGYLRAAAKVEVAQLELYPVESRTDLFGVYVEKNFSRADPGAYCFIEELLVLWHMNL